MDINQSGGLIKTAPPSDKPQVIKTKTLSESDNIMLKGGDEVKDTAEAGGSIFDFEAAGEAFQDALILDESYLSMIFLM